MQSSSAQRRASPRSTEKKTDLILSCATSSACRFAAAYEDLRSGALGGATRARGNHFGLVILLREGVAAWIERIASQPATDLADASEPALAREAVSTFCDGIHAELVAVLASMIMATPQEKCA